VNFLLGTWTEGAKAWGDTVHHKNQLDFNARNQLTLWGPQGQILDYAGKQWSGLTADFYLPRYQFYINLIVNITANSKQFNETAYEIEALSRELDWCNQHNKYPVTPSGDSVSIVNSIYKKYAVMPNNFTKYSKTNVQGFNLLLYPTWSRDPVHLAILCNADSNCLGFTTNGFLKTNVNKMIPANGVDLYIKNS